MPDRPATLPTASPADWLTESAPATLAASVPIWFAALASVAEAATTPSPPTSIAPPDCMTAAPLSSTSAPSRPLSASVSLTIRPPAVADPITSVPALMPASSAPLKASVPMEAAAPAAMSITVPVEAGASVTCPVVWIDPARFMLFAVSTMFAADPAPPSRAPRSSASVTPGWVRPVSAIVAPSIRAPLFAVMPGPPPAPLPPPIPVTVIAPDGAESSAAELSHTPAE